MPQFTFTAFRWTGTFYNAQYNTSHTVVIDDDDANLDGGSDPNETVSIDGGPFTDTISFPYDIDVSFTDVDGDPHVETFYFFLTDGNWYFIPGADSEFTVGATLGSYQSHVDTPTSYDVITNGPVTCFVLGTLIETDNGPFAVEDLRAGDRILTADGTYKTLRVPMSRKLGAYQLRRNPKLAPVRIMAGALGNGFPKRDLLVSRQHRMLVSSKVCERMFGETDVLVAAIKLTELPGIYIDTSTNGVEYFHLLFDQHEVIFAEGAPSESFYAGRQALMSVSDDAREEISSIFPDLDLDENAPKPAFHIPSGKLQKKLVARHLKNNQPCCECSLKADREGCGA